MLMVAALTGGASSQEPSYLNMLSEICLKAQGSFDEASKIITDLGGWEEIAAPPLAIGQMRARAWAKKSNDFVYIVTVVTHVIHGYVLPVDSCSMIGYAQENDVRKFVVGLGGRKTPSESPNEYELLLGRNTVHVYVPRQPGAEPELVRVNVLDVPDPLGLI